MATWRVVVAPSGRTCASRLSVIALTLGSSALASVLAGPIEDLQPGRWYEVPNSRLEAVFPNPPPRGNTGPNSVMDAWSGGAFDSQRDRLIVWGGGHQDYAGNEIYAFDVNALSWTRVTEPTPSNQIIQNAARYADGRPSARHTYNYLQYSPEIDALVSLGLGGAYGGSAITGNAVDAFNFGTGRWEVKTSKPTNGSMFDSISAYDPISGKLYHHGALDGRLTAYDPLTNKWEGPFGSHFIEAGMTAAIDPVRRIMVATGGANNEVAVWDLKNPALDPKVVDTSGDATLQTATAPGFVYDPVCDRFVGWNGGVSIYALNPDTWTWTKIGPAAGNIVIPTQPNVNGTFGRFRYISSKKAFIVVNRTDENVFIYKLPAATSACTSTAPQPASLQLSASTYSIGEGDGLATIAVSRAGDSSGPVSVAYATSNGTAIDGADYTFTNGALAWAIGETAIKTFSVPIIDDGDIENSETVNLILSNPDGGATLGTPNTAVLTITDNEPPVTCNGRMATIVGTSSADNLTGTAGADVINGLGGDDVIFGLGGNDVICGNDGNDIMHGDPGTDQLLGGAGDDICDGGAGTDTALFSVSTAGVTASLATGAAVGEGADSFMLVERLTGTNAADTLTGNSGANVLNGLAGNDRLIGGDGNDDLSGSSGNDTMDGGVGTDTCNGGAGTGDTQTACETVSGVP